MAISKHTLPDKTIVDRTRPGHNAALSQAINQTRQKLTAGTDEEPGFDKFLLVQHLQALETSAIALPVLVVAMAAGGFLAGFGLEIVGWALVANIFYGMLVLLAKNVRRKSSEDAFNTEKWSRGMLAMHAAVGTAWAMWAMLPCTDCQDDSGLLFKAMGILIAMAATATVCFNLRWVTTAAFAVPVLTFIGLAASPTTLSGQMMIAMLAIALVFFSWLANHLGRSHAHKLRAQTRNSALIAELEVEKSISEAARKRAEEANLAKSRFLASMSHELRTPLNAILGFSEVMDNELMGPIGNPQYVGYVRDIHQSGKHLLNVINEILDLSRIEAGKYEIVEAPLTLQEIASDCVGLIRMRAEKKSVTVDMHFEEALPKLMGDEKAVRQIILNLLSNAVKFTPQNGTILVKVGWTASGGQYVSIKDSGPGIPDDEIPIVMSTFGQGSIAIKSAEQGSGLGLPIVQALMQLHGGRFKLESALRKGVTATAIFPPSRTLAADILQPTPVAPAAKVA